MCSAFDEEDIDALPDPAKEYQITIWYTVSKITLLMKWIILYKEHNVLITKIEELIKTTDTINKQCNKGYTALILASRNGHEEIVRLLLKHPTIDVNLQNNYGEDALHYLRNEKLRVLVEYIAYEQNEKQLHLEYEQQCQQERDMYAIKNNRLHKIIQLVCL